MALETMEMEKKRKLRGISIFIPVYNEEKILRENTLRLKKYMNKISKRYDIDYEIVIVSNGSDDKTNEIGENLNISNVLFYHVDSRGVGLALRRGIRHCHFSHIITVDMDLSIDLGFIEESILLIKSGTDIVVGSKQDNQKRKIHRLILSKGFIFLTKLLLGIPYTDYSIAAKVWEKEFLMEHKEFIDDGSSYVINLLAIAHNNNKRIKEIEVLCIDNRKVNSIWFMKYFIDFLISWLSFLR